MRIGMDIDDVLFPWYQNAHELCVEAGITNGVQPRSWYPYDEYGATKQAWLDVMNEHTLTGRLYGGPPAVGAVEAMQRITQEGHTIHLVTARGYFANGERIRQHTREWLQQWAVPHDQLVFSKDKTVVKNLDYFLDDNPRNFMALELAGVQAYLLTQPWNADVKTSYRVDTVGEYVDIVLGES